MTDPRPLSRTRGFTLVELLVVVTIILIVSAVALPAILPALDQRKVSSAALLLQAELARARDQAIRDNEPRGIRLLPEPPGSRFAFAMNGSGTPAYTRMIAIAPAPDYSDGMVRAPNASDLTATNGTTLQFPTTSPYAFAFIGNWSVVMESKTDGGTPALPRAPTSWYWNIRQGDKITIADTGKAYTIVGPMLVGPYQSYNAANPMLTANDTAGTTMSNTERYINWGTPSFFNSTPMALTGFREFLIVLDGLDGDNDGFVDEAFDGIDNDNDGVTDPGFDGKDNDGDNYVDEPDEMTWSGSIPGGEFEPEQAAIQPTPANILDVNAKEYTILRRPAPARGARELVLPAGVAIDMTTWNPSAFNITGTSSQVYTKPERSRLPVDPQTGFIDIMIAPNGQAVQTIAGPIKPIGPAYPFFHFWIADTEDIVEPLAVAGVPFLLPMPPDAKGYQSYLTGGKIPADRILRKNRRLVSLNTRSGQVVTTTLDTFDLTNPVDLDVPFLDAQAGGKVNP